MQLFNAILLILGGLVFFVFGLHSITGAFKRLSGVYIKVALNLMARNRVFGLFLGIILSFLFASTSGATVLLVGMGNAGLLTLRQALGVILGAAIGTTLTVQLIAFDIGNWSLCFVIAGFLLLSLGKYKRWRDIGSAVFGVGMLFFGMEMMKGGVQASLGVEDLYRVGGFLKNLSANPFHLFLAGIVLTAVLQSSATTIAIAFAFGMQVSEAIPLALGASIGTCAAGLISGIAAKPAGRRIAIGHLLMKLLGASFFMLILSYYTRAINIWSMRLGTASDERIIAHANTLFCVLNAVIFLPLLPMVEEIVMSITRERRYGRPVEGVSLADLDHPSLALAKAQTQVAKMGRTALEMLRRNLVAFLVNAHKVTDDILADEEHLDTFDAVLSDFLGRIDETRLSPEENKTRDHLLYVVKDIEHIGDVLATELVPLARRKASRGIEFSIEGAQQFDRFHRLVADDFSETIDRLEGIPANLKRVIEDASQVDSLRRNLVESHIRRISQGVVADAETTRILLDAVAALRSIHYYAYDIAMALES